MHARANAKQHVKKNRERARGDETPPALLASAPVRIWLVLIMATSSVAIVAALSDLIAAPELLQRIPLSLQIIVGAVALALFSFSIGAASARPIAGADTNNDDQTVSSDADAPGARDPLPDAASAATPLPRPDSGPRWLMWIDDRLTRPVSRTAIVLTVAFTSGLSGYGAWHWFGGLGEALTTLVAVAIVSALFSRVSAMASSSRQTVAELRTTNDRLVHEIVTRRLQAGDETPAGEPWAASVDFDDAKVHEIEALRTKFLDEVSHELRGPITAINLAARIIMKHHVYDHDVVERFGSTIVTEGDRLAHIVNDFLELAKIESGCTNWQDDSISTADIVNSAIFAVEAIAGERSVTLCAELDDDLQSITVDRDRVVQAVTILTSNVVRAARENATVTVHARRGRQEALFAVEEKGAASTPHKFDIFKAAAAEPKGASGESSSNGHGLALCIASEIAAHYGGDMWVEGRDGSGSAILISIPDEGNRPASGRTSRFDGSQGRHDRAPEQSWAQHDGHTAASAGNSAGETTILAASERQPGRAMPLIGQPGYVRPGAAEPDDTGDSLSAYLDDEGYGEGEEAAYIAETTLAADDDDTPRRDALAEVLGAGEPHEGAADAAAAVNGAAHEDTSSFAAHFEGHTDRVDAMSAASEAAASAYGESDPFDPQTFFDRPYARAGKDGSMPSFEEDLASMERYESMLEEVLGKDTELGKDFEALSDDREYVDALHLASRPHTADSAAGSEPAEEAASGPAEDAGADAADDSGAQPTDDAEASLLTKVKSGFGFSLYKSARLQAEIDENGQEDELQTGTHGAQQDDERRADDNTDEKADDDEPDDDDAGDDSAGGGTIQGSDRCAAPAEEPSEDFEPLSIAALPKDNDTPAKVTARAAGLGSADSKSQRVDDASAKGRSAGMIAALPGAKVSDKTSVQTTAASKGRAKTLPDAAGSRPAGGGGSRKEHGG